MGEGLWKVAQSFAAVTDLFRIKANMISITKHLLEHQAGFFNSAGTRQCLNQPEAADAEGAFAPADSVHRVLVAERVAMNQAIHRQSILDSFQGPNHARVGGRNKEN